MITIAMRAVGSVVLLLVLVGSTILVTPASGQGTHVYVLTEAEARYSEYAQPVVGYDFVPNSSFSINALGVYDHHFDGLYMENQVGLWDRSTGTLLAKVTVSSGTGAPLVDGYRWVQITPRVLAAGTTYCVASWNSGYEPVGALYAATDVRTAGVTLTAGYLEGQMPGLGMPARHGGPGYVFIGPGIGTGIPEPGSLGLVVLAAGMAWACRRGGNRGTRRLSGGCGWVRGGRGSQDLRFETSNWRREICIMVDGRVWLCSDRWPSAIHLTRVAADSWRCRSLFEAEFDWVGVAFDGNGGGICGDGEAEECDRAVGNFDGGRVTRGEGLAIDNCQCAGRHAGYAL